MKSLEKNIGYTFRDKELLKTAVTHSSYANENRGGLNYNERLEFLGDAVLQLITSEKLFCENPTMPEGKMSKVRAALVCEDELAGAIFLDGGMENAKKFVLRFLDAAHRSLQDYKTLLQEIIQKNPGERLSYVVTGETGPDHDKSFTVEVHLNSNIIGKGTGKSKKQAEQAAAKEALALMGLK